MKCSQENGTASSALPRRPLLNNHAKVVELADNSFHIAADHAAVFGRGGRRFGDRDDTAVGPRACRNGDDCLIEIGQTQLEFLATGCLRAEQSSLPQWAGIRVRQNNAQRQRVGADRKKGISPRSGVVDVDIEALGGQRNLIQVSALLVTLGSSGLGLVLGLGGVLGHADDGLFFLVAGH